jgi:predicted transport protein
MLIARSLVLLPAPVPRGDGVSDIKLFRIALGAATEIQGTASHLEKPLQTLIEGNLEPLLGIRFVETEYSTGKTHAGRIDTLGLDENNSPVIIEYKRDSHENIINQGLFYLDWLMDHKAEFQWLVLNKFGKPAADSIDWLAPRLICIAADFTKYDGHAVQQINRNIELLRYRQFGMELLLLELVNAVGAQTSAGKKTKVAKTNDDEKPVWDLLAETTSALRAVFDSLESYLLSLGDDVQRKDLKLYIAFKRLRNFVTVNVLKNSLLVFLHLDPDKVKLVEGFTRDVSKIGHWGTGNIEATLKNASDLDKLKPLIDQAYEGGSHAV